MADDVLGQRSRRLEDEFFLMEDQKLIEQFQRLRKLEETREALAQASGLRDAAVLQKLIDLGIHPGTVAALSIVPLVEVAWADGAVSGREREAVLRGAEKLRFEPGSAEHVLLEEWLARRPDPRLLKAWTHLVEGLVARMAPEEVRALKEGLLRQAREVAAAAGGFLGMGTISDREKKMLSALEAPFRLS